MSAIVLNLPKWLLVTIVFCVALGHFEQVECKITGCATVAVNSGATVPDDGDSSPGGEAGRCDCQCHFTISMFEVPVAFTVLRFARDVRLDEQFVRAPEAPCAEIEYPPLSVRA